MRQILEMASSVRSLQRLHSRATAQGSGLGAEIVYRMSGGGLQRGFGGVHLGGLGVDGQQKAPADHDVLELTLVGLGVRAAGLVAQNSAICRIPNPIASSTRMRACVSDPSMPESVPASQR